MANDAERQRLTHFLKSLPDQTKVEHVQNFESFSAGNGNSTFFYSLDRRFEQCIHLIKCVRVEHNFIATDTVRATHWRDHDYVIPPGTTTRLITEHILKKWSAVISDEERIYESQQLWKRQMAFAAHDGYKVGVADIVNKTITWCDRDYPEWITDHRLAWTDDASGQNLRFVIARP